MPHMGTTLSARLRTSRSMPPRVRGGPESTGPAGTMAAVPNGNGRDANGEQTPYVELDREAWAALGTYVRQPLSPEEIVRLRGLGDHLDLDEVQQVYLPL